MSVQVKRRRDTAANVAAYTGAQGELIVDTTNNRVTVHDGATAGGWAAAKLSEVVTAARTAVADANYTTLASDRAIAFTALTAARVVTLPAAASYPVGVALTIFDESGAASASKTISFSPNAGDVIEGGGGAVISSAYGYLALQSNGAASPNGKWTIIDQASSNLGPVGVGTAADPNNPLSVYGASALFNGLNFNFTINKSAAANTASLIFEDNFSGRAQIGLTGDDNLHVKVSSNGTNWLEVLNVNAATGQPTFVQGIAAGEAIGFRNRLRNATFAVNQRTVSGAVTLAAGAYGHDGVKAGASGATYTFATTGLDTTLTVTAGSLILPIEAGMTEGGAYTLSQAGTAQARIWQGTGSSGSGSYAAGVQTVSGLSVATQTNVEFSSGTVLRPQFEPGAVATAFERRPPGIELALCQRYYQASIYAGAGALDIAAYNAAGAVSPIYFFLGTPMRATPTATLIGAWTTGNISSSGLAAVSASVIEFYLTISATGQGYMVSPANGGFTLSAEI
jgi:hypothetical protein